MEMLKKTSWLLLLSLVLLGCSKTALEETEEPTLPVEPEPEARVKVVAHRGAWKEFGLPDNSVAALRKAIEIGSDVSECDIQLTKDHQVVVYHDEQLAGKFLKDLTYAEVLEHSLSNGEKIALLSDFLKIVVQEDFQLWLDIKSLSDPAGGNAWSIKAGELAAELIRNNNAQKNVAYIVGRKAVLDKCIAAIRGDWEAGYMNVDYSPEQFVSQGLTWANFAYSKFYGKPAVLKEYLEEEIRVSVYTVDDEPAMEWFLSLEGIYAISTNYPASLISKK